MILDLYRALPTEVGDESVFALSEDLEGRLLLLFDGDSGSREAWYGIGDIFEAGGSTWTITEVLPEERLPEGAPPGTGASDIVARIKRVAVLDPSRRPRRPNSGFK